LERFDAWQRRQVAVGFVVGVARKYAQDRAYRHAARIAYYAFFSVFPLLLAFVSIVGFVLQSRPSLRRHILDSALSTLPVIGPFVRNDVNTIGGSGIALFIGIALALWAGLGITIALGQALDDVWSVAPIDELGYVSRRLRGLATLALVGLGIVASAVLGGLTTSGRLGGVGETVAAVALSLAVDAVALAAAFRLLTTHETSLRDLLPGVVLATLGMLTLQLIAGWYLNWTIGHASATYGLFATVIGLLAWFSLASQLLLVSAEVNAVRALHLWPRSLRPPMTSADKEALERYAECARRDAGQRIIVRWVQPERGTEPSDPRNGRR
jgi:membrane protein